MYELHTLKLVLGVLSPISEVWLSSVELTPPLAYIISHIPRGVGVLEASNVLGTPEPILGFIS